MTGPSVVEQYWTGVASQLQVEADVFNRLVEHNGEMGRANELALAQLVTRLLPSSVAVGTGVIIDCAGNRSKQTDLIVYERASQPQILAQSTQLLYPVETVVAAIEVKTTVDTAAIDDAAEKFASIRGLAPSGDKVLPLTGLFGFNASGSPSERAKELNALDEVKRPDVACVLNPGLVSDNDETSLNMSLVPLHDLDSDGIRRSMSWIAATTPGASVVRGNATYPVSRFRTYGDRYVFEPGRALLLFGELLLGGIGRRAGMDSSWLTHYLPDTAREVVPPG